MPEILVNDKEQRMSMGALNKPDPNALKYYDVDINADPPSKSEPPSSLPFDEPISGSFFRDLESPQNHPPLRRVSIIRKSKDDFMEQQADAVELQQENTFES